VAPQLAGKPLTIQDAVSIALATNRSLAESEATLYRYAARTSEARSALNPVLSATGGDVYLADAAQPAGIVGASVPLDISGLLHAATTQAQFEEVVARLDVNGTRNQVVADVKSAFYNILRAEALVAVATQNLQDSLDRLHDANLKYQVRAVAYFDVVRAQTDVANAQKQVIQARNAVSTSTAALNSVLGIEVTTPLHLTDQNAVEQPPGVPLPNAAPITPETSTGPGTPENAPLQPAPPPAALNLQPADLKGPEAQQVIDEALKLGPEFAPILQESLTTRPEMLEADAGIAAARQGILLARQSLLPGMRFTVGYYYLRNSTGTRWINEPEAQVMVTLPLYDGGLARAREREARGVVATAITDKRQTTDAITQDVEQAYLNLIEARDQVAVANQALAQAREAFELARVRYNAGVSSQAGISPLLEVSDAQAALTLAESNQVNALYDYNLSRAQLDRAAGRFAYGLQGSGYSRVPPPKVVGQQK
jgi:outer membrane protein TolC